MHAPTLDQYEEGEGLADLDDTTELFDRLMRDELRRSNTVLAPAEGYRYSDLIQSQAQRDALGW